MDSDLDCPFKPGSGMRPPHRAGHEEAATLLNDCLGKVLGSGRVGDGVILLGPRGNGKTALMEELAALARGKGMTVRRLSADSLKNDVRSVCHALLAGMGGSARAGRWQALKWWLKANLLLVTNIHQTGFAPQARVEVVFRDLLKAGPLLVLVDEAHDLPADIGGLVLHASHTCFREDLPLLIVLAGTPATVRTLRATKASFWERFRMLSIGRLEGKALTREALSIPAKNSGVPFDEEALDLLVEESQSYPFFVQVLGEASWMAARGAGNSRITLRDARQGIEDAKPAKEKFYALRFDEAAELGILVEAHAVSKAMQELGENPRLSYMDLTRVLADSTSATGNSPGKVMRELENLGLIWFMPDSYWEPGIPSLCEHFAGIPVDASGAPQVGWGELKAPARPKDPRG